MTVREALEALATEVQDELVICTNGYIARSWCAIKDRPENFYMIGSMGLASSISLGLASSQPKRKVVAFDGDGAVLMALGALPLATEMDTKNFYHVVLDNEAYASTGGQMTSSRKVELDQVARASGYPRTFRVGQPNEVVTAYRELVSGPGPGFLLVKCELDDRKADGRIPHTPTIITQRVMEAAQQ